MNVAELKDKLEALPSEHHIELLRILKESNTPYNENQNGVFVNLSQISEDLLLKLHNYVQFADLQKSTLDKGESQREEMKDQFFSAADYLKMP
jgi:hypothetical protein